KKGSFLVESQCVERACVYALARAVENSLFFLQTVGREEHPCVFTNDLLAAIPEQTLGRTVPGGDNALKRFGQDRIARGFDNGSQQSLILYGSRRVTGNSMRGNIRVCARKG